MISAKNPENKLPIARIPTGYSQITASSSDARISNKNSGFAVETMVLPTGERLPLLLHKETGLPSFEATAFALQTLRSRGSASNTIEQALRSIAILTAHHQTKLPSRWD